MKFKSIITFLSAVILFVGTIFSGFTAMADELPIVSLDVARTAMLQLVDHGSRSVQSDTMDYGFQGSVTYTSASGNNAEDVLAKLFATNFVYRVINTNDQVNGYIWLYDKFDTLIFFGATSYGASSPEAVKPLYTVWMQNLPLLTNVSSAEVLALDNDGKTANRTYLTVDQYGRVIFQPWMSGSSNGLLSVKFKDGSVKVYDLWSPVGNVPGLETETADFKIDGHYVMTLGTNGGSTIKIIEAWSRPTVYLTVPVAQSVSIDVLGMIQEGGVSFERPYSMEIVPENGGSSITYPLSVNGTTSVFVSAGKHRIIFKWIKFGKPGLLYTGPIYIGKG